MNLFACQMPRDWEDILHYASQNLGSSRNFWQQNRQYWQACGTPSACFHPRIWAQACQLFPRHVMKTTRLGTLQAEDLLHKLPNLKLLLLVRDPRGLVSSRMHFDWCNDACLNTPKYCHSLETNLNHTIRLANRFDDRIRLIRYEDLCADPYNTVANILKFLGLPANQQINQFLREHTTQSLAKRRWSPGRNRFIRTKGHYLTFSSDPVATSRAWLSKLSPDRVKQIETDCANYMKMLGYLPISPKYDEEDEEEDERLTNNQGVQVFSRNLPECTKKVNLT